MNKENILLIVSLVLLSIGIYNFPGLSFVKTPNDKIERKFQVGDCIQFQRSYPEIWDTPYQPEIVLSIGNYSYRTADFEKNIDINSKRHVYFDSEQFYQKVSCNNE